MKQAPYQLQALDLYLNTARSILLITHQSPDGDAIGSLLGLKGLLEYQGKTIVAACQDGVPEFLRFLPGWTSVVKQAQHQEFDLLISLDASDLERLGTAYQPGQHEHLPLINIDHHITNLRFGTLNLVDSEASSTALMLCDLAASLNLPFDADAAQCLLTGIVSDTNGLRTSNVSARELSIAQELVQLGASLPTITENLFNRRSLMSIYLWGLALNAICFEDGIIWTTIPLSMRAACAGTEHADTTIRPDAGIRPDGRHLPDTGLVNFLVGTEGAYMAAVLSEREDGHVDVGLRAVSGMDVAQVALDLGGGGHAQAAGCRLRMPLAKAERTVLEALKRALLQQLKKADASYDPPEGDGVPGK